MTDKIGELTLDQVKRLIENLVELRDLRNHFSTLTPAAWKNGYENIGEIDPWGDCYEVPLFQLALITGLAIGEEEPMVEHIINNNHDAILNDWPKTRVENREGTFSGLVSDAETAAMTFSLMNSIDSLEIYGKSLHALIADVRDGDDYALFNVVRLDHSAVSNPTIAQRMTKAKLENDQTFFNKLGNALKGKPNKNWASYRDTRFILAILNEMNFLDSLSENDAYQLFCIDLEIYPLKGKDPAKNLAKFIERWKDQMSTTSNRDFMSSSSE